MHIQHALHAHPQGLEDRGLVVRNTVIIPGSTNSRFTSIVHLRRFVTLQLNKGQALWLGKPVGSPEAAPGEGTTGEQVMLADDTRACRTVCKKLEEQNGQAMIVKLLKEQTGFVGKPGHRAWRKIKKQLIDNGAWMCEAARVVVCSMLSVRQHVSAVYIWCFFCESRANAFSSCMYSSVYVCSLRLVYKTRIAKHYYSTGFVEEGVIQHKNSKRSKQEFSDIVVLRLLKPWKEGTTMVNGQVGGALTDVV